MRIMTLAFAILSACSKPAATPPPATPAPTPTAEPAPAPTEHDLVALEHDPGAQSAPPPAEPHQAALAASADADGTVLYDAKKFADASAKFRDAFARAPTAKYGFDMCRSLYQEGKFGEALTACAAGLRLQPDAALATDLNKLSDQIKNDAKAQGITLRSK